MESAVILIPRKITSLIPIQERLFEARYFIKLLKRQSDDEKFIYCLNAFISAARSSTFVLQKEMAHVPEFREWWVARGLKLGQRPVIRYFQNLRNYAQKEGRISIVGASIGQSERMVFHFAGTAERIPDELLHRDIPDCCYMYLALVAESIMDFSEKFPFQSCASRAFTSEGMEALGHSEIDLYMPLGFAREYSANLSKTSIPIEKRLEHMRRELLHVNFDAIRRLSKWKPRRKKQPMDDLGTDILSRMVIEAENAR